MELKKLPVFPNWFPYNDLLLDGHLKVDQWEGVKTRNWEWNYRGPVLLYNSLRTANPAVRAYQYKDSPSMHKMIIGAGELIDVRLLTQREVLQMVCNFNNVTHEQVKRVLEQNDSSWDEYIVPFDTGFFFKNLRRFKEPVPFNWPSGPVKPIFTKIVSGSKLHRQLQQSGF